MRVAAVLTVKDEIEIIGRALAHLQLIGIDHVIACDMGSTDGTFELLESRRSDRDFWVLQLSDRQPDHFETWSRVTVALAKSAKVDWVIFLDADEFWIPATGLLKDCVATAQADVLFIPRFNVPLTTCGPLVPLSLSSGYYDDLKLLTQRIPDLRHQLQRDASLTWIMAAAEDKIMVRPDRMAAIDLGAHDFISGDTAKVHACKPTDLLIAHLPFTTESRFMRKLENIRKVFSTHGNFFGDTVAWHWRRWLDLADEGRAAEEFRRSVLSDPLIDAMHSAGTIKSASQIFKEAAPDRHSGSLGSATATSG